MGGRRYHGFRLLHLAGLEGLICLLLLMAGTYVLVLYYYAYQSCRNAMAAFLACVALLPLASSFTLRPQMLGYIFLMVALIILEQFRQGHQRTLWLLPVLFLIWVNTHGTFVLGFFVMGVYWAAGLCSFQFKYVRGDRWPPKQRQQLELTFLLCLLASIVTP